MIKAADENQDGKIGVEELQHLLKNIQAKDPLTEEEILDVIHDVFGPEASDVPIDQAVKIFLDRVQKK